MGRLLSWATAAVAVLLATAGSAAAAGKAVNVATPFSSGPPSVAVTGDGHALVAWANTKDLAGVSNFVQYCVLPPGATACAHAGSLSPADSAPYIDGVQVLADGGTLVILADVFGAAGDSPSHYEPVQEWQSTDGGATWSQVNAGVAVTDGILNADTGPLSAVIVPGTGVLGFGWDTAGGSPPTFNAFPLSSPPECSRATCPAGFATLQPSTNPDQIGNPFGQFAAQGGAQPGVLAIFDTLFTNGPLGCPNPGFGTAFAYGSGNQSATNSYNISPGSPGSAWRVPVSQADCHVENPGVGGGPSGFGVLETNDANSTTVYHRFDAGTMKFDLPMITVAKQSELDAAVSQDGSGGVYGTYLLDGAGGPVVLSYSADGGKSFASGVLDANQQGGADHVTSHVNASGQGWAAWQDNGSIFAQPFTAADAISPASVGGSASSNGATVTLTITCASLPCTVTVTISSSAVTVSHTTMARRRAHALVLATGRITLRKGKTVTLPLTAAGKRYLKHRTGRLTVGATIAETLEHHTVLTRRNLTLRLKGGRP